MNINNLFGRNETLCKHVTLLKTDWKSIREFREWRAITRARLRTRLEIPQMCYFF